MADSFKPSQIIEFWFSPPMARHWFNSTEALDRTIRQRFAGLWSEAANGHLDHWAETAEGALALCVVLDQFPLNMFRGQPAAFRTEQKAVAVTKACVAAGFDKQLPKDRLAFLYMPLMHSESMADQRLSVQLFEAAGLERNAEFARHHRDIIERFGRFPHRNAILGRLSRPEEVRYLDSPEAFTG
jgi:uncharacterized protein (DUF924 family)